ncbi:MAG: DUF1684 domain-containing protein [Acidobacteria bacterium]|nr:DUF1684 domain-containing protein [Acidobacteriota bacterium]
MPAQNTPQPTSASTAVLERWARFRKNRNAALAAEHGWLTLTSFQWLPSEPGALDLVPGLWWTDVNAAFLQASDDDGLTVVASGESATGLLSASLANEDSLMWVQHKDTVVELAVRGDRYAIRTRDETSPVLQNFSSVPTFDYNPDAVVTGTFHAYSQPKKVTIGTYRDDVPSEVELIGEVTFDLAGQQYSLAAEGAKLGALTLTFHDASNGISTDNWRKLELARPRPDGTVVVDFNRAINYPSAFTPFGTCPQPVAGNRLDVPVEAGEKTPKQPAR